MDLSLSALHVLNFNKNVYYKKREWKKEKNQESNNQSQVGALGYSY